MSAPITRKCACGCRRTFTVPYPSVEKVYYDRHCSNNHTRRTVPKRYRGAEKTAGIARPPREYAFCDAP